MKGEGKRGGVKRQGIREGRVVRKEKRREKEEGRMEREKRQGEGKWE